MERFRRYLFLLAFVEIGAVLIFAPWTIYWDRNTFIESWQSMEGVLTSFVFRGAVSGIGIVNWIAALVEARGIIKGGWKIRVAP